MNFFLPRSGKTTRSEAIGHFSQNLRGSWANLVDPSFGQKLELGLQFVLVKFWLLVDFWPKIDSKMSQFLAKNGGVLLGPGLKTQDLGKWLSAKSFLDSPSSAYMAELSGVGRPTRATSIFGGQKCAGGLDFAPVGAKMIKIGHFWRGFLIIFGQFLTGT